MRVPVKYGMLEIVVCIKADLPREADFMFVDAKSGTTMALFFTPLLPFEPQRGIWTKQDDGSYIGYNGEIATYAEIMGGSDGQQD